MILDLVKDDLNVLRVLLFELPLQEATTMLVLAQSIDLSGDLWDGGRLELIISIGFALLQRATVVVSSNGTTNNLSVLWVLLVAAVATLRVLRHRVRPLALTTISTVQTHTTEVAVQRLHAITAEVAWLAVLMHVRREAGHAVGVVGVHRSVAGRAVNAVLRWDSVTAALL